MLPRPLVLSLLLACSDVGIEGHEIIISPYTFEAFYYVPPVSSLDVVLVMDTSGSMRDDFGVGAWPDELLQMTERLNGYLDDWRLAVIPADPDDATEILGGLVLDSASSPFDVYVVAAAAESASTQNEQGLAAIVTAYADGLDGFFRQDVPLLGVFVSDERDQSHIAENTFNEMWTFAGVPTVWSAVVGVDQLNTVSPCHADLGRGYLAIADVAIDVCDYTGWDRAIAAVEPWTVSTAQWTLSVPADPGSIRVWVDDTEIFSPDWTYLPAEQAIRIEGPLLDDRERIVGIAYIPA